MWSFLNSITHYETFTIKAQFFDIHKKESEDKTIYGSQEWY